MKIKTPKTKTPGLSNLPLCVTFRLVDQLVSQDSGGGRIPGHPEAGVPFICHTEVSGLQ